jgi:nitrite reductase/ring-hydroxylating ferredoxin subunit
MAAESDHPTSAQVPRRAVLGFGALGVAGLTLAACGGTVEQSDQAGAADASDGVGGAGTPSEAGPAAAIPVGGAAIVAVGDTAYVVAQPNEGKFVAHSAVCPHQGCLCNEVTDNMAICPCHGSAFNADTGAVQRGPATRGLAPASVAVVDGTLQIN